MKSTILEKVTCHDCQHFLGLIHSDGSGPILEACASDDAGQKKNCVMVWELARFMPPARRERPMELSNHRAARDEAEEELVEAFERPEVEE